MMSHDSKRIRLRCMISTGSSGGPTASNSPIVRPVLPQRRKDWTAGSTDDPIGIPASTDFPHTTHASTIHLLELFDGIPVCRGDKAVAQVRQGCRVANFHDW